MSRTTGTPRASEGAALATADEYVRLGPIDSVVTTPAHDVGEIDGVDMAFFDGAASYLLDDDDIHDVSATLEQLKQLGELRDAGILTPDEFEAKKAAILG